MNFETSAVISAVRTVRTHRLIFKFKGGGWIALNFHKYYNSQWSLCGSKVMPMLTRYKNPEGNMVDYSAFHKYIIVWLLYCISATVTIYIYHSILSVKMTNSIAEIIICRLGWSVVQVSVVRHAWSWKRWASICSTNKKHLTQLYQTFVKVIYVW